MSPSSGRSPTFIRGGDVPSDADLTRTAELGAAMHQPFLVPLHWMQSFTVKLTGGYDFVSSSAYSILYQSVLWLLLPLIYGTVLFFILRLGIRLCSTSATHAAP